METNTMIRLQRAAGAFATNRYIDALKSSFFVILPITMGSSIFILISNVVLNPQIGLIGILGWEGPFIEILRLAVIRLVNGTINIISPIMALMIGYHLGEKSKSNPIHTGLICLCAYFILIPEFSFTYMAGHSLFTAIITGIGIGELFIFLSNQEKLKITLPEMVPPAVSKSFSVLIPSIICFSLVSLVAAFLTSILETSLPDLIRTILQEPFQKTAANVWGLLILSTLQNILWVFGIHGAAVTAPIRGVVFSVAELENVNAFVAGVSPWDLPHLVTWINYDLYGNIGGAGGVLALSISILLFSKREEYRQVAKLGIVPNIFNIAEIIVFGLPIVMNPIFIIPFILTPLVTTSFSIFMTVIDFAPRLGVSIPWTTPVGIGAFLASGGHWQAGFTAILCLIIGIGIYTPFVLFANTIAEKETKKGL